jgi:hypothetical protein
VIQKPSRKKARLDPDLSNDALSREGVRNIKEEVNEDDKVVVKIEYVSISIHWRHLSFSSPR